MSEAESLELIALYTANAITSFSLYISFTFAFLVAAYFVGRDLSRFQAITISGLYFVAAISGSLSLFASVHAWVVIKRSTATVFNTVPIYNETLWLVMMPIILVLGILISIYFMWDVRHRELK
jgi:hypothetical protein